MSYEKRYNTIDLLPDVAVGIKLPMLRSDGVLFELSYSTEDQVISNLKNLILTRKGERIMQPEFGTTLQDSLFEQNTELLVTSIRNSIQDAVSFWLPYVSIDTLTVDPVIAVLGNQEDHGVTVSISVLLNGRKSEQSITFLVTANSIELI
jgi:phage baseplate assembly protein W